MSKRSVAVIGGGVAGSAAAYVLNRQGYDVVLLEAAASVGGRARTVRHDGFAIDAGAVYLLNLYECTHALMLEAAGPKSLRQWSPRPGCGTERRSTPFGTTSYRASCDFRC